MSENIEGLKKELEQQSTEELISILRNRDEEEWRPEVFELVSLILKSRGVEPAEVVSMGPEGIDVVESEPTVTIATFFSPAEAHGSRMALDEASIPAWVVDEQGGTMYGVGVGTRLQVRFKDVDAAREVLSAAPAFAMDLPRDLAEPPCPACGSFSVALEAWRDEADTGKPWWQQQEVKPWHLAERKRKWYYVCAECQEAWPA